MPINITKKPRSGLISLCTVQPKKNIEEKPFTMTMLWENRFLRIFVTYLDLENSGKFWVLEWNQA